MDGIKRPEKGERILAEWARRVVDILRQRRLVPSRSFDIRTDSRGTSLSFRKGDTKKSSRIGLDGVPSRFLLCRKTPGGSMRSGYMATPYPLGFAKMDITYAEGTEAIRLFLGEMVDGEPLYDGDYLMGSVMETKS